MLKICENCKKEFDSQQIVDNKLRNFSRRKYCLECSPFNSHNTRPPNYKVLQNTVCVCLLCKSKYTFQRHTGVTTKLCTACVSNTKRKDFKTRCLEYLGKKCYICGYNKCNRSLHFHHKDPSVKEFTIGSSRNRKWDKVKNELDKCIIVCSNCHGEIHDGMIAIAG